MTTGHAKDARSRTRAASGTVDPADRERFARLAENWWDERGPFSALHAMNPPRLRFIRAALDAAGLGAASGARPFAGLRLLDVGAGGGLISEPMARLGFTVTAIDSDAEGLGAACAHAEAAGLEINHRLAAIEDLVAEGTEPFDVVLALEVVEHVSDRALFLRCLAGLTRPGGVVVISTLSKTIASLALAKIAAEYVLRLAPPGTHDWRNFIRPDDLERELRHAGLRVTDRAGFTYNPLFRSWSLTDDLSINYALAATKPGGAPG